MAYAPTMATRIRKGARAHLYIREWMEHRGLSDETLGNRLETSRTTVFRWRKEQHRLDPGKIAQIASALDCEPEELWRPPGRISIDAMLKDAPDEEIQRAAAVITAMRRSG